jgi:hypothetical protein
MAADNKDAKASDSPRPRGRKRRWRRRLAIALAVLLALLVGAELFARYWLGLGDPPLYVADGEIEYLLKPSRQYRRLGRRIAVNAYSMRADDFPRAKQSSRELRVLLLGDSVLYGGSFIDRDELISEVLKRKLESALSRPVVVGNASAGSWGPPNLLAYARRFGFFGADVVVVVLSSHDYADAPTGEAVVGEYSDLPERTPLLALEEAALRYLPRYLGASRAMPAPEVNERTIARCAADLRELLRLARGSGAKVWVAQHLTVREMRKGRDDGWYAIASAADEAGVPTVQLGPALAGAKAGRRPFLDNIHPSPAGNRLIAAALSEVILAALAGGEAE